MVGFTKKGTFSSLKDAASKAKGSVSEKVLTKISDINFDEKSETLKARLSSTSEKTKAIAKSTYSVSLEMAGSTYESVSSRVESIDYDKLKSSEYYKGAFSKYRELSTARVSEYFKATFELEKEAVQIVESVRDTLPVPAKSMEEIFSQCKEEATRRAIAGFFLNEISSDIDKHSEDKYQDLAESYGQFSDRTGNAMFDDPNFADMKNKRFEAKKSWFTLEDGYHKDAPLDPYGADIEHVVSRKDYFSDVILRAGTTDDQFCGVINSKENLVFANSSLNRALQDKNVMEFIEVNGAPRLDNPDIVDITIKSTGEVVTVRKSDVEQAYEAAEKSRQEHRFDAAYEVAATVVETGMVMAVQQVVGLIIVETIDVFVDEIQDLTLEGFVLNSDELMKGSKERAARLQKRLGERFEERKIWERARLLGIEAGVSGALSVIPQILISLVVKMPAFVLSIVRECTLSVLRCVRLLASKVEDKLGGITVILAGSVAAIVGVYVSNVISTAIAGVPILNQFNSQISNVISGVIVVAVPLSAIYVFDQNKHKLTFKLTGRNQQSCGDNDDKGEGQSGQEHEYSPNF